MFCVKKNNKKSAFIAILTAFGLASATPALAQDDFSPQILMNKTLMSWLQPAPSAPASYEKAPLLQTVSSKDRLASLHPYSPADKVTSIHLYRSALAAPAQKPSTSRIRNASNSTFTSGVFGSVAINFGRLPAAKKLNAVTNDQTARIVDCTSSACRTQQKKFTSAISNLQNEPLLEKLRGVNTLVNGYVTYRRDVDNYGSLDHWASPAETLQRGSGDCEDYAILKMAALEKLGVSKASMSVVVLRDERRNLFHAVLTVRTTVGSYVLDNIHSSIKLDRELAHYMPLYSVSAGKGYIHGRKASDGRTAMSSVGFDKIAPGEGA